MNKSPAKYAQWYNQLWIPVHPGWYCVGWHLTDTAWRWWNGLHWSSVVYNWQKIEDMQTLANVVHADAGESWSDYWPENARVERRFPAVARRKP